MIVSKAGRQLGDIINCCSRERKRRKMEGKESGGCKGSGRREGKGEGDR